MSLIYRKIEKRREELIKEKAERENSQREYLKYSNINMFKDFKKPLEGQYNKVFRKN